MNRRWLRWLPAVVAPVVIAAGALAAAAATDVDLPAKTPEQVLSLIGEGSLHAFSGTVEQKSELGLPALPTSGKFGDDASTDAGMASALELLSGIHTARVYVNGPDNSRVQLMDSLAERDLIRNGHDVWWYDSAHKTATHVTLPSRDALKDSGDAGELGTTVQTPTELAHRLLTHLAPSTEVKVGDDTRVAGRTAYDLIIQPKNVETLIGSVSIAVDSETGLPLSVEVHARGQQDPAFSVAFTALTLERPTADTFTFKPSEGTKVTEQALPNKEPSGAQHPMPTISGSDWTTIIQLPAGSIPSAFLASPLVNQATSEVEGGRLLGTSLVNVLVMNDGRAFVGSVTPDSLQAAAAQQAATAQ
jgi:outer membrane lipoprotein-sorting protein